MVMLNKMEKFSRVYSSYIKTPVLLIKEIKT